MMAWYLVCGLGGMIIGFVLGVLIDRDTVNKYYNKIRKVKVKGDDNTVSDLVNIDLRELKKKQREEKRILRRSRNTGEG